MCIAGTVISVPCGDGFAVASAILCDCEATAGATGFATGFAGVFALLFATHSVLCAAPGSAAVNANVGATFCRIKNMTTSAATTAPAGPNEMLVRMLDRKS